MIITDPLIVGPWVAKKVRGVFHPEGSICIGRVLDGRVVAGVWYENFNGVSITGHIAADPGGITRHFLWAILHYAWEVAGVTKILAPVGGNNEPSIKFVERLGFRREACIADAHPHGDLIIFSLKREDCRFEVKNG